MGPRSSDMVIASMAPTTPEEDLINLEMGNHMGKITEFIPGGLSHLSDYCLSLHVYLLQIARRPLWDLGFRLSSGSFSALLV